MFIIYSEIFISDISGLKLSGIHKYLFSILNLYLSRRLFKLLYYSTFPNQIIGIYQIDFVVVSSFFIIIVNFKNFSSIVPDYNLNC